MTDDKATPRPERAMTAEATAHNPPWLIDQDNWNGITVKDDCGNVVHECDYGGIPDERGSAFREQIIYQERVYAHAMVTAVNSHAALKEENAALREALKPFAEIAFEKYEGDNMTLSIGIINGNVTQRVIHWCLKIEDFRRASAALRSPTGHAQEGE